MKSGGLSTALQCPQSGKSGNSEAVQILIGLRNLHGGNSVIPFRFAPIYNEIQEKN